MCSLQYIFVLSVVLIIHKCAAEDVPILRRIKECLSMDGPVMCLKEKALDALNETIMSENPLSVYGIVDIIKNPDYTINNTHDFLPRDLTERSSKLNELLYDKVEEFFDSRSIKINLGHVVEGRKKNDKKGSMMMMGGLAMAGMMAQMFMGKIAFMAGAALLVAKLALLLSTVIGFKKLSGGGSGGRNGGSMLVLGSLAKAGLMMKVFMGKVLLSGGAIIIAMKLMIFMFLVVFTKFKRNKRFKIK